MRKLAALAIALLGFSIPAFSAYTVVMKDGSRYNARTKWIVSNGKAIITLTNGTSLQVEPAAIDVAKTDEANRLGLGTARVLERPGNQPQTSSKKSQGSLGGLKLRTLPPTKAAPAQPTSTQAVPAPQPPEASAVSAEVIGKFQKAYENVGLFDAKVSASGKKIRVELVADTEEHVFKAISATAFVMANVPSMTGEKLDLVELYMGTLNGGAAGRFQMLPPQAEQITKKQITWQTYYVNNVLF